MCQTILVLSVYSRLPIDFPSTATFVASDTLLLIPIAIARGTTDFGRSLRNAGYRDPSAAASSQSPKDSTDNIYRLTNLRGRVRYTPSSIARITSGLLCNISISTTSITSDLYRFSSNSQIRSPWIDEFPSIFCVPTVRGLT